MTAPRLTVRRSRRLLGLVLLLLLQLQTGGAASPKPDCPEVHLNRRSYVFENKCYEFIIDRQSRWTNAKDICEERSGQLVQIKSESVQNFLAQKIEALGKVYQEKAYWIGASDRKQEGVWQWMDGTRLSYAKWFAKLPRLPCSSGSSLCMDTDCVIMRPKQQYRWFDHQCRAQLPGFICEYYYVSSVASTTTTGRPRPSEGTTFNNGSRPRSLPMQHLLINSPPNSGKVIKQAAKTNATSAPTVAVAFSSVGSTAAKSADINATEDETIALLLRSMERELNRKSASSFRRTPEPSSGDWTTSYVPSSQASVSHAIFHDSVLPFSGGPPFDVSASSSTRITTDATALTFKGFFELGTPVVQTTIEVTSDSTLITTAATLTGGTPPFEAGPAPSDRAFVASSTASPRSLPRAYTYPFEAKHGSNTDDDEYAAIPIIPIEEDEFLGARDEYEQHLTTPATADNTFTIGTVAMTSAAVGGVSVVGIALATGILLWRFRSKSKNLPKAGTKLPQNIDYLNPTHTLVPLKQADDVPQKADGTPDATADGRETC